MLQDDRIAQHEVRRRKTCNLVIREIPGHHAEQCANGQPANHCCARRVSWDVLVSCEIWAVICVILENLCGKLGFFNSFYQSLADLLGDDFTEVVLSCIEKLCCFQIGRASC